MTAEIGLQVPPVRAGNLFEATMERLLRAIRLGQFPPGSKLPPERDLAELLGVSRTTLREALAALQTNGYVSVRRGRYGGTYVASSPPERTGSALPALDAEEVADLLTLRRIVEPAAAELAAGRDLPRADRDRLRRTHREVAAAPMGQYRPLDSRLHLLIAECSGSPSLLAVVADARARANAMLDRIPLLSANLEHSGEQHAVVVQAVLDGDPAAARAAMLEHLDGTAALLRGFLG